MRQTEKKTIQNRAIKSRVKTAVKALRSLVMQGGQFDQVQILLRKTVSEIYKAKSKGVVNKLAASRTVGRLTVFVNKNVKSQN